MVDLNAGSVGGLLSRYEVELSVDEICGGEVRMYARQYVPALDLVSRHADEVHGDPLTSRRPVL